jgi:hypothetical protein
MNMQIMVVGNAEDAIRTIRHALAASGVFVGAKVSEADGQGNPPRDDELDTMHARLRELNDCRGLLRSDVISFVPTAMRIEAARLVARRNALHPAWALGGFDNALFLDFWHSMLPGATYVCCLEHYSSALQRAATDAAGDVCLDWCVRTAALLAFLRARRPPALVLHSDRLPSAPELMSGLAKRPGFRVSEAADSPLSSGTEDALPLPPLDDSLRHQADRLWQAARQAIESSHAARTAES